MLEPLGTVSWSVFAFSHGIDDACFAHEYSLGLHFFGNISLGTQYANAVDAKPKPMRTWAAISRYMSLDPGAIAAPMNEMIELPTRISFRAWKVSEAEERIGAKTAWTRESALGTQVWVGVL